MPHYIALAVPFFLLFIGLEVAWAKKRGEEVYRFADSVTDLSCGIASQLTAMFFVAARIGVYTWVYEQHRFVTYQSRWWPWLLAFFGVDFAYYWWHRASHEVNLLWAAHVVHHQSEEYNLSVALRQAVTTGWTSLVFYLPLALLGVPPLVYGATHAASTLYQFWIHTRLIGKQSGLANQLFNLPSHHRVHHAINPGYLDKNYGATLIVWDRLFGTFAEEVEPPVYGITKPLRSFNPLWAQFHVWVELARRTPKEGLRVWFHSPAWSSSDVVTPPAVSPDTFIKYDPAPSARVTRYVALQLVLLLVATFLILLFQDRLPFAFKLGATAAVLLATWAFAALLEGRRFRRALEAGRLALTVSLLVGFGLGLFQLTQP